MGLPLAKRLQAYLSAKNNVPIWTRKFTRTKSNGLNHETYECWIGMYSKDDTSTLVTMTNLPPKNEEAEVGMYTMTI